MPRLTLAKINAALAARGIPERLAKGKGYFYFHDGEAHTWPRTAVYVNSLNQQPLEEWIEARHDLAGMSENRRKATQGG
jgi:hypothetical protein